VQKTFFGYEPEQVECCDFDFLNGVCSITGSPNAFNYIDVASALKHVSALFFLLASRLADLTGDWGELYFGDVWGCKIFGTPRNCFHKICML